MTLDEFYERAHNIGADIAGHLATLREEASTARLVIEVGVGHGNSSSAFLMGVRESSGRLWSVDIEPTSITEELQQICPEWEYHVGDSLALEPEAPFDVDVLFIDSDHSYESTKAELELYAKHVRPGGVILCHDTGSHQPGVARALDAVFPGRWTNNPECYGLGRVQL